MMRLLLPVVLLLLGIGGGVGAGMFLGSGRTLAEQETASENAQPEEAGNAPVLAPGNSLDSASGITEYVRLNNQFVVPIVRNGSVRSLVVMSLTIEVDAGQNSTVFNQEPRLRDAFLQVMFAHANAGGFDGSFTQAAAMDPLREALGEAAQRVLGSAVHDVLIVDINRQDA
jgi:hypothetical protein